MSNSLAVPMKRPLHERIGVLGFFRQRARAALFRLLSRLADTDDAKRIQVDSLRNLLPRRAHLPGAPTPIAHPAYSDLGKSSVFTSARARSDVIMISARFRSGSTLLWNLFRNLDDCTAYYEPFNERRWFDPAARGTRTDASHRGIDDYWREYEGLAELGRHYREHWTHRHLFMDADSWDPDMKSYVEQMIERAAGRPVLQFNRIDFRLPWLSHEFPHAKLIHLYRHPRDQWASALMNVEAVPRSLRPADFVKYDHYYLLNWARDLKYYFPFLDESSVAHPYQLFYFMWKLSFLFGRHFAHFSLAFEDLIDRPEGPLTALLEAVAWPGAPIDRLTKLIDKPRAGRWRLYAPESWYQDQESACEDVLAQFWRCASGQPWHNASR